MSKEKIAAFFDQYASTWDEHLRTDDAKIDCILDHADIHEGSTVLDVACGTGVLFPYYAKRNAARVIGVDLSEKMAELAQQKAQDLPNIEVVCGDIETLTPFASCTSCVVYNAMPHFKDHERLIEALSRWVKPGGQLVIAHSMGLKNLARCHSGSASGVSFHMPEAQELADLMSPWFAPLHTISTEDMYLVAAQRKQ